MCNLLRVLACRLVRYGADITGAFFIHAFVLETTERVRDEYGAVETESAEYGDVEMTETVPYDVVHTSTS
jgi:hypothetical protein